MAWTLDTALGTAGTTTAATLVLTTTAAVAPGGLIVLAFGTFGATTVSSVSGGGLTWTEDIGFVGASTRTRIITAFAAAGLAPSTAITITPSGSTGGPTAVAASFLGGANNTEAQTGGNDNASSTSWLGGSIVTTGASDLVVGAAYTATRTTTNTGAGGFTGGASFTSGNADGETCALVYQLNCVPGTYQPGGTWGAASVASAATSSYEAAAVSSVSAFVPSRMPIA